MGFSIEPTPCDHHHIYPAASGSMVRHMKKTESIVYLVTTGLLLIGLSSCSTWQKLDDRERGTVIGGASGAALGSAVDDGGAAGTVIGGALGAGAGNLIGDEVDEDDA